MSLSIPYVLRAALETAPGLRLLEDDGMDMDAAERLSRQAAQALWNRRYRPGDTTLAVDPVTQLAAARLGLVVVGEVGAVGMGEPSGPPGDGCDLDTVETRVWSQTPLTGADGGDLSQGGYLEAIRAGQRPPTLRPLTRLVLPILTTLEARPSK